MDSRSKILRQLRESLDIKEQIKLPAYEDRLLYKDYPSTGRDLSTIFQERLGVLKGEFYGVKNISDAAKYLIEIIEAQQNKTCLIQPAELIKQICNTNADLKKYLEHNLRMDSEKFAGFEVAVTTADYLVARTGSIVLNSHSAAGRRLSVLPPIHIVIAEEKQIVASLEDVLKRMNTAASYSTIITGPSRTADIEKQLVLGAHGPKRLIVILLQNDK
jgi:L-lactate dehydrogenase complex protein LldG